MKDIVYTRKYTDQKGQERKEYVLVGYLFEKDGKTSILMKPWINVSALQNDKGEVWLGVYDHKPKEQKAEPKQESNLYKGAETVEVVRQAVNQQPKETIDNNDDVPF